MIVEGYDEQFINEGDSFDKRTGMKVRGFADLEKLNDWREKMENVLKRRLCREREKSMDVEYFRNFRNNTASALNQSPGLDQSKFSRESMQLFESMKKGE